MDNRISARTRASSTEVNGAIAFAVLALGGAVALPLLAAAEPGQGLPTDSPADASWWIVVGLILIQAVALLWVKRAPQAALIVVTLIPLAHAIVLPGGTFSLTTIAVSFVVFWAVLRERPRRLVALLITFAVVIAGAQVINDVRGGALLDLSTVLGAVLQAVAIVGIPLVIGLFFAARRDTQVARGKELLALKRERDALIQAAVSRERMAMSRELHDIAAHHMSGIALLASAIYRQVDRDPAAAKLSAQQVRAQSMTVLDDLRRVVGLLRDEAESSRSVETLAAVPELVALRRASGIEVKFEQLTGEREFGTGIGPLAQLVAYRMVQESLANAAAHAPGANCVVEIDDRHPEHLTILVTNDGSHAPDPGPGGGFGLVGMRERADLVGAELEYHALDGGGWLVRLTLERDNTMDEDRA